MTQRNPTCPRLRRWLFGRRALTSLAVTALVVSSGACSADVSHLRESEAQPETQREMPPPVASSGAAGSTAGALAYAAGGTQAMGGSAGVAGSAGASAGATNGGSPASDAESGGQSGTLPIGMNLPVLPNAPPPGQHCSDHPITPRSAWSVSASSYDEPNGGVPANLLDNHATRWSSGKPQSGDEWLQVDFGSTVTLRQVNLQQGFDYNDYPRSYALRLSDTALNFSGTVGAQGDGQSGVSTTITLAGVSSGRYLRILQLGSSLSWWSAEELEVSCFE